MLEECATVRQVHRESSLSQKSRALIIFLASFVKMPCEPFIEIHNITMLGSSFERSKERLNLSHETRVAHRWACEEIQICRCSNAGGQDAYDGFET